MFYFPDKVRERYNRQITKYQEIAAVSVNVSTVIIIYILVNYTQLGYMHNNLANYTFRICCLVLVVQGITIHNDLITLFDFLVTSAYAK